ncbi:succinate dehydrogenase, cytochrome b556 subunit [Halovenus sp. WSH3]|uniref:Succinate dehydrogenase, cytochrome b556 subunit n=1 Tax=Halovenus carboxidivorans TaxID=2692199 RepID=A0A6B0T8Q5_9EURY|nr:succinate dehydrogenase, cytochrome b556 subunit [Halovenus carboxidivorans]MXR52616.1 succinate dehydrogenase, cytochrome b556 subunit [Halovenus carboxidivorans]
MSQSYDRGTVESFGRWLEFKPGMWAWILHKLTGWILVGYLFTHIAVLSTATGVDPAAAAAGNDIYTTTLQSLEELLIVRFLEIGLLTVAVFHILNGIRLLFVDLGLGLDRQDVSFYVSLIMTALITLASLPTFLGGVL